MNPTEQAHNNLKNVLLSGRILLDRLPLTANELSGVLQGEQLLYEKATRLDKANQLATEQKKISTEKNDKKKFTPPIKDIKVTNQLLSEKKKE